MEWIVIANREGAQVYKFSKVEGFELIKEFSNPLGRLKNTAMQNDQAGSSRAKFMGSAPHRLEGGKDPHEEAANQFVGKFSKALLKEMKKNNELTLRIVAEGKLLGKIRSHFKEPLSKKRIRWVEKDLKKIPEKKWPQLIGLPLPFKPTEISNRFPI